MSHRCVIGTPMAPLVSEPCGLFTTDVGYLCSTQGVGYSQLSSPVVSAIYDHTLFKISPTNHGQQRCARPRFQVDARGCCVLLLMSGSICTRALRAASHLSNSYLFYIAALSEARGKWLTHSSGHGTLPSHGRAQL